MNDKLDNRGRVELDSWIKQHLDAAVRKFIKQGKIDSLLVEAKSAWVLPFQILIGKIRAQGSLKEFDWFICGEVPTDYLESSVASTPRETARHFAMKWQLAAARYEQKTDENPVALTQGSEQEDPASQLVRQAEALYAVVEDDRVWLQQNTS
jgi:hypothetical protein